MIFAENPPVTDSDAQAVASTEKLQGQLEIVSSATTSTSAPISLPGSPDLNFDAKFPLSAEMSALGHTENEDPDVSTTEDTIQPFKSFQAANALTDGGDEPKYN